MSGNRDPPQDFKNHMRDVTADAFIEHPEASFADVAEGWSDLEDPEEDQAKEESYNEHPRQGYQS